MSPTIFNPYRYAGIDPTLYPQSCGTDANASVDGVVINTSDEILGTGCLSFDGTNDFVECNALDTTCGTASSKGTITLWANFDTVNAGRKLWGFGDTDGNSFIYVEMGDSAEVVAQCRLAGTTQWKCTTGSDAVSTSGWYLISLTQDGVEPKIYVNAVEDTTFTVTTDKTKWVNMAGIDNFRLGTAYYNGANDGYHDGLIDDVGLYSKDIGASLISDLYNSGTGALVSSISHAGCVAYYNCDELDGSDLLNNALPIS